MMSTLIITLTLFLARFFSDFAIRTENIVWADCLSSAGMIVFRSGGKPSMENDPVLAENMIVRDSLAIDRTMLANERTMLAYLRTFIGLLSSGVGMVTILDFTLTSVLGLLFILVAPILLVLGFVRYRKMKKKLDVVIGRFT